MKSKKDLLIPFEWNDRKPVLLDRFFYLPKHYEGHESFGRLDWADERIFGNSNPVCIEICSGNGQWIGERAKRNPEWNWVGVELRFDRARKIWLKSYREEIPNLYTVCAEGKTFLRYYAPLKGAVQAFVNFPDPWPKLRHAKHRIVQAPFLQELSRACTADAVATFVTDDSAYRDQMVSELGSSGAWKPLFEDPHYRSGSGEYGDSYFSSLWREKGRELYFIQYANGQ